MSRSVSRFAWLVAAALLPALFAAQNAFADWSHDPSVNDPVCTAAGDQMIQPWTPSEIPDGAGGAIIVWYDHRGGDYDIYVQRMSALAVPLWTTNGVPICTAAGDQVAPAIVTDSRGGAIITWMDHRGPDYDVYAQRVDASGNALWTANGVALCTTAGDQYTPQLAPDGAGGAVITWEDRRTDAGDIYAQRVNSLGVPQWSANGLVVCNATNRQSGCTITTDGAGGAIILWTDYRSGDWDVYGQRVSAAGAAQWTANGKALRSGSDWQVPGPGILPDGAGGAYFNFYSVGAGFGGYYRDFVQRVDGDGNVLWGSMGVAVSDLGGDQRDGSRVLVPDGKGGVIVGWYGGYGYGAYTVSAQRLNSSGSRLWGGSGVSVNSMGGGSWTPSLSEDGTGGAIVTWSNPFDNSTRDIYGQRIDASGSLQWGAGGIAVCSATGEQEFSYNVSDGAGGAIVVWYDGRSGSGFDIDAQQVGHNGVLGSHDPAIVSITDVPNDQGGKVSIRWIASNLDAAPGNPIDAYWIWREVPAQDALAALASGARLATPGASSALVPGRTYRTTTQGTPLYYWEFVGSQVAHGFPAYSYTTATLSDSVAGSNPYTLFMVESEELAAGIYWSSAPDSAYSVDNLAPAAPAMLAAHVAPGGGMRLSWQPNAEPDLAGYRVYRGASPDFAPGPLTLIGTQSDTGWVDPAQRTAYYKVTALDVHGNEGVAATLSTSGPTGVDPTSPGALSLAPVQPNPMSEGGTIAFTLPRDGVVTLDVLDAQGRIVRVLASGILNSGTHVERWDGTTASGGRAPAGLYWVRLTSAQGTLSRRVAVLR